MTTLSGPDSPLRARRVLCCAYTTERADQTTLALPAQAAHPSSTRAAHVRAVGDARIAERAVKERVKGVARGAWTHLVGGWAIRSLTAARCLDELFAADARARTATTTGSRRFAQRCGALGLVVPRRARRTAERHEHAQGESHTPFPAFQVPARSRGCDSYGHVDKPIGNLLRPPPDAEPQSDAELSTTFFEPLRTIGAWF